MPSTAEPGPTAAADLVRTVGIDPFDAMDAEAARIDAWYAGLDTAGWSAATRCAGWDRRDLLAHLAALEDYVRAGLDGTVQELLGRAGAGNLDAVNAWGIAQRAELSNGQLLDQWRVAGETNRRELRRRGVDATIDTSVGDYPLGRQAYYLASELATHADDAGVPVPRGERAARLRWRAAFAVDAVAESADGVRLGPGPADAEPGTVVVHPGGVPLSAAQLVEAAAGRLVDDVGLPAEVRRALVVLA